MKTIVGQMSQCWVVMLLLTALLMLIHVEGWAADWKLYSQTAEALYYFDPKTVIISEKKIVGVEVKQDFTDRGVIEMVEEFGKAYQDIGYELNDYEINCPDKKFRVLSVTRYSPAGKVLLRASRDEARWTSIPPDSTSESLRKMVCSTP